MPDFKLISADCHISEPPEAFARVAKEYGDRAPKVVENPQGYGPGLWIIGEGLTPMRSAYFGMGYVIEKPKGRGMSIYANGEHFKKKVQDYLKNFRYEDYPQGWEPSAYLGALDQDGIEAALIFPSWARYNYVQSDAKYQRSIFRSYNEWVLDFAAYSPKRLFPVPMLSILDIDLAIADMKEYIKRGCKTVMIPTTIDGSGYYEDMYEPLWQTAEDLGIPLTVHSGSSQGRAMVSHGDSARKGDPRTYIIHKPVTNAAGAQAAWEFVSNLIFSGVFDRHPKLKVACAEFEVGEAASVVHSIDYNYGRVSMLDPEKTINKRWPSEYFFENIYFSFEDDPALVRATGIYGENNFIWGSDFPHHMTTYPLSPQALDASFEGIDPNVARKLARDNAIKLYQLF